MILQVKTFRSGMPGGCTFFFLKIHFLLAQNKQKPCTVRSVTETTANFSFWKGCDRIKAVTYSKNKIEC